MYPLSFTFLQVSRTKENYRVLEILKKKKSDPSKRDRHSLRLAEEELEEVQAALATDPEYRQLCVSGMKTTFHDQLILTMKVNDIRPFQNIIQLLLDWNNKIMKLEATPLSKYTVMQNLAQAERDRLNKKGNHATK